jgi:adenylate cyclase
MTEKDYKRKLTAILSADVAGYSRLMGDDEAATVKTLEDYKQVMFSLINQHRGRVIDSPGDNILAELSSVVDAVQCAVSVQKEFQARKEELSENRRMQFRIGVNLGDVIEEEDRIYGDGVNIAARLEALADPGGICVSGTAYDQIGKKLPFGYKYLGEQKVKNIEKPVRVYRVLTDPESAGKVIGEKRFLGRISRRVAIASIIILVIIAAGLLSWIVYLRQSKKVEAADPEKMAFPLPDKPSIAVLPFDNLSDDPGQDYFSDGLTEEIISGLSMIPDLFVIARNSSFIYKNKPVKVQQVSEELGVRYVLEGSVRREGDRVRITAQLIDAIKGHHIWSGRYDREVNDIFALQEDIMRNIILEMQVKLTEGEQARLWAQKNQGKSLNLEAFEKGLQAAWYFKKWTPEGIAMARKLSEESIKIEPNSEAYALLAHTYMQDLQMGSSESPRKSIALAEEFAKKTLQLDNSLPHARTTLAMIFLYKQQHDEAIAETKKALDLYPKIADTNYFMGYFLHVAGRNEEAIPFFKKAIRLNPYPPSFYYVFLGGAYNVLGRYDGAVTEFKKALKRQPDDFWAHIYLVCSYCWQDRLDEARAEVQKALGINPQYSIRVLTGMWVYKDKELMKTIAECLRKAGIPEG